jgi:hypothetical protein
MTKIQMGSFDNLVLVDDVEYKGKSWRSLLVVPLEQIEDLYRVSRTEEARTRVQADEEFWTQLSQLASLAYLEHLQTQQVDPNSSVRQQWYQWTDLSHLEAAYRAYKDQRPIALSIVPRLPSSA